MSAKLIRDDIAARFCYASGKFDNKREVDNCAGACLIGQYMAARGIAWTGAPSDPIRADWGKSSYARVARALFEEGPFLVPFDKPHTFGAALARARSLAVPS